MYQRFGLVDVVVSAVSFIAPEPLACDPEHESNGNADQLIRDQKENGRDRDHHEHHSRGDRGFAARRPGHLAPLLAHFLQEAEGTDPLASHLCRRLIAHPCSLLSPTHYLYVRPVRLAGVEVVPQPRLFNALQCQPALKGTIDPKRLFGKLPTRQADRPTVTSVLATLQQP